MTIEEMKNRVKALGYTYEQVARISGVPLSTLRKVFAGATKSPRYETMQALEKVLRNEQPPVLKEEAVQHDVSGCGFDPDRGFRGKKQGEYTIEDYLAIPVDDRFELIDGVLFRMDSPTTTHQKIAGYLYHRIYGYIDDNDGDCQPFIAPVDVQLDCDDRTIVEPDVMILCDDTKDIRKRIYGAPDFVAEVLSPSTRRKDMLLKLHKYGEAGVREYWMIDPEHGRIMVYQFESDDATLDLYSFEDEVPVGIYDGKCRIDFAPLNAKL